MSKLSQLLDGETPDFEWEDLLYTNPITAPFAAANDLINEFRVDLPEAPTSPSFTPPTIAAPDMSKYYAMAAANQDAQNKIGRGQLDISRGQAAIGEEQYEKWKTGYMPIEKKAMAGAKRGIDPEPSEARARASGMGAIGRATEGVRKQGISRGVSSQSPASMARRAAVSQAIGVGTGSAQEGERERVRDINRGLRGQIAGLGQNIPQEVVAGYGAAAGAMGSAGQIIGSANQAAMGLEQQKIGQAAQLSQQNAMIAQQKQQADWNNQMQQYNFDIQQAQAEAQANSSLWSIGGMVLGGVIGFFASGGNPIGATAGAAAGSALGGYTGSKR